MRFLEYTVRFVFWLCLLVLLCTTLILISPFLFLHWAFRLDIGKVTEDDIYNHLSFTEEKTVPEIRWEIEKERGIDKLSTWQNFRAYTPPGTLYKHLQSLEAQGFAVQIRKFNPHIELEQRYWRKAGGIRTKKQQKNNIAHWLPAFPEWNRKQNNRTHQHESDLLLKKSCEKTHSSDQKSGRISIEVKSRSYPYLILPTSHTRVLIAPILQNSSTKCPTPLRGIYSPIVFKCIQKVTEKHSIIYWLVQAFITLCNVMTQYLLGRNQVVAMSLLL